MAPEFHRAGIFRLFEPATAIVALHRGEDPSLRALPSRERLAGPSKSGSASPGAPRLQGKSSSKISRSSRCPGARAAARGRADRA